MLISIYYVQSKCIKMPKQENPAIGRYVFEFLCVTNSLYTLFGSTSGGVVTLKTLRREVPGSNPGRSCRPSRSEFSVVFSETPVNPG